MIAAVIIAAITLISHNTRGGSGFVTNSLTSMSKPLRSAAASVARVFESIYGYMYEYDKLKADNEELKKKLYQLQQDNQNVAEITEENDRLHALFDLSKRHPDYERYDTAEVLSWSASNWSSSFSIGKGASNSKVKVGDCVITETGALVGIVSDVEANASTVTTILDTKFSCGAYIQRNGDRAVATGDFSLMKDGLLKFDFLQDTTDVNMGDQILTSGKGGVLPAALVIGTVQQVMTYPTGISRYATIKPAVELSTLTNVFLITSFEITEVGADAAAGSSASPAGATDSAAKASPGSTASSAGQAVG